MFVLKDEPALIAGATVGNSEYKGAILDYNHFWIIKNFRHSDRGAPIPEGAASGGNSAGSSFCAKPGTQHPPNQGTTMLEQITNSLAGFNKEIAVVVLAAMPVSELRGAIPLAIAMGFSPLKAYMLSFFGNLIPVIPLLFLLQPLANKLRHIKIFEKFFDWLFERTRKKASLVEKFEALGLILFVAIPLPVTGAWTGCVAATLFKIRFRYAFIAVALGIIFAGFIVLGLSLAGKNLFA